MCHQRDLKSLSAMAQLSDSPELRQTFWEQKESKSFEGKRRFTLMQEIKMTSFFFFSKALKHKGQAPPTEHVVGSVKIAWLYTLQVYSFGYEVGSAAKQRCVWSVVAPGCCEGNEKTPVTPEQSWRRTSVSGDRFADCPAWYWTSGSAELQALWKK